MFRFSLTLLYYSNYMVHFKMEDSSYTNKKNDDPKGVGINKAHFLLYSKGLPAPMKLRHISGQFRVDT